MATQRVGSYEILRVLARGGMATVYLADQPALDRQVALKRLDIEGGDPAFAQRFVEEAHVVARLDHPNIVTVLDFCEADGQAFIAMEYVSGGSLRPHVGRLRLPQVLGVLDDMLSALAHAAAHGVTHRDLKPENVLVTPRGSVKIADFGIALAQETVARRLTGTGMALGTPAYMAPEQAGGGAPPDPATDLYSLGVMAFELLAGRLPYPSDGPPIAVLYRHAHEPVPSLHDAAPQLPPALAEWVERLLAKDPAARPRPVEAVRQRLEEIAVGALGPYWRREAALVDDANGAAPQSVAFAPTAPQAAAPIATAATVAAPPRRRRLWLAGAAVGVVGAGAALGVALAGGGPADDRKSRTSGSTAAAPFAFAGGRDRESVVGLPTWTAPEAAAHGSGAVLLLGKSGAREMIGAPRPRARGGFGAAVASGDFDSDGFADLAVGVPNARVAGSPGRPGSVTILRGSSQGLRTDRTRRLTAPANYLANRPQGYGTALAAADLNRDGYADLVIGAPGNDPFPVEEHGSGSIQVLTGGPDGVTTERARTLGRPRGADAGFGRLLAVADVDRDGHVDVLEASAGHSSYCPGGPRGPTTCHSMGAGARSLAATDMTGDGRADVLHGVPSASDGGVVAGLVRVWRGSPQGPRDPLVLRQDGPHLPGNAQAGDEFGASLAAGDLDRDGFGDLLVGAPGEDGHAGRLTLVRGARRGYAVSGNRSFEQGADGAPGEKQPGNEFGAALALAPSSGDGRVDLTIASPGDGRAGTLWMLREVTGTLSATATERLPLASLDGDPGARPVIALGGTSGG